MTLQVKIAKEDMVNYIRATLIGGMSKRAAYSAHINFSIKDVDGAIMRLEKRDDFIELYQTIVEADQSHGARLAMRVKAKYMSMTEKNIDVATSLLEDAESAEEKAKAVRLANETFGAMAIIGVANPQDNTPLKLDKTGVVI